MAKAKMRKDILSEGLSIPAKQKATGSNCTLTFKGKVDTKEHKEADDFYNTEIILHGVSYLVNSIDLDFI